MDVIMKHLSVPDALSIRATMDDDCYHLAAVRRLEVEMQRAHREASRRLDESKSILDKVDHIQSDFKLYVEAGNDDECLRCNT